MKKGETYLVNHRRKGRFFMMIDHDGGEWVEGTVVGGVASAIMNYNVKEKGENITVRKSFCDFTLQP